MPHEPAQVPAKVISLREKFGYGANVQQSERTIEGLRMMMSWIPSGIAIVAATLVLTYGITRTLEKQIEEELAERKKSEGSLEV